MTKNENGAEGGTVPSPTKRWDWHSRDGRRDLDAGTLGAVAGAGRMAPVSRGWVATWLGLGNGENELKVVSMSLRRNAAEGLLSVHGFGGQTTYEATAKGRRAVEKGAGR